MNGLPLPTLIDLKLVAGRHKDLGDVIELIRRNKLDESFAQHVTPSLRARYIHCLEQMRLEDEWEENQNRA